MIAQLWRITGETDDVEGLRGGIFEATAGHGPSTAAIFVLAAVAIFALAACAALVRDHVRLEKQSKDFETTTERLRDDVWELRDSEERYRSLVEGQGDLIYRRDDQRRLTYVNEAFALVAGRPAETLIGAIYQLPVRETLPRKAGEGGSEVYDQAVETSAGTRWISWVETPVHTARGGREIQVVGRDVTVRRQTEAELAEARLRAEAANEAKSRFLATVSHEIRTPLNGVLGMADLLLGTRIDLEQSTYVRAVKTSGEALLSIIEEILDFSRIESGRLELAHEPFDLLSLVEGTVELLAPRAQGKDIEIASYIAPDVELRLMGDPARLRQVLNNLAGNAVKFTDTGGVGVRVTAEGDLLRFSVCDTGIGIPADRARRHLRRVRAGRGPQRQPAFRHRARPGDLAPPRRRHGWRDHRHQRAGPRLRLLVRPAAREGAGRRAGPLDDARRGRADRADRIGLALRGAFLRARLATAGVTTSLILDPDDALESLRRRRPTC